MYIVRLPLIHRYIPGGQIIRMSNTFDGLLMIHRNVISIFKSKSKDNNIYLLASDKVNVIIILLLYKDLAS
jgi:hypothetical protein